MIAYVELLLSCGCIVEKSLPIRREMHILCHKHKSYHLIEDYIAFKEWPPRRRYVRDRELEIIEDKIWLVENLQTSIS